MIQNLDSPGIEWLPEQEPLQVPVTIIDLERGPVVDMNLPMADSCPGCGGLNMTVGDWVCWGHCYRCMQEVERDPYSQCSPIPKG